MPTRLPALPKLLARKIYKTGQTRGADNDQIWQNRVSRTSTVLIPYKIFENYEDIRIEYENRNIILLSPKEFFNNEFNPALVSLGENALVFFQKRQDWERWNPNDLGWLPASSRINPLGGQYVARIADTTSSSDERINLGFAEASLKGAGIRCYEYASTETNTKCKLQLESLFWFSRDSITIVVENGMNIQDAEFRKQKILENADAESLLDLNKLEVLRTLKVVDGISTTKCPLCFQVIEADQFFLKEEQAEGREVHDLTVTKVNLFHIEELRPGLLNHRPYNLGWGHHHCNVVTKDMGVEATLEWMKRVLNQT